MSKAVGMRLQRKGIGLLLRVSLVYTDVVVMELPLAETSRYVASKT